MFRESAWDLALKPRGPGGTGDFTPRAAKNRATAFEPRRRGMHRQPNKADGPKTRGELHLEAMQRLRAHVRNGRLVLDEPTDLPEGEVVELVPVDELPASSDAMRERKLTALRGALDEGIAELDAGLGVETTPDELMAEISAELGLDS